MKKRNRTALQVNRTAVSILLALTLFVISGCTFKRPEGPVFRASPGVFLTADTVLSPEGVMQRLQDADFILVGEGHTNPCDHRMQARIIRLLGQGAPKPVLGLEMIDVTGEQILERFNRRELDVETLPEAIGWEHRWGYPYSLYRPVFLAAEELEIPVHALNLPSRIVRKVGQEGLDGLDVEERKFLPEELIAPPADQEELLQEQFEVHASMLDGEGEGRTLERFMLAQSLWDSFMAQKAAELSLRYQGPVIILAGAGHVEYNWGIGHRLEALLPDARIVSIVPWRGVEKPQQGAGDLFFFCPAVHRSRMGYELEQRFDGLRVRSVHEDSRAADAGLEVGDVIQRANDLAVNSLMDLHQAGFAAGREGEPLTLTVVRDGRTVQVTIERDSDSEE